MEEGAALANELIQNRSYFHLVGIDWTDCPQQKPKGVDSNNLLKGPTNTAARQL